MAQLLGSKYCIESLRSDVSDLQGSVVDVLSRTGPIRATSWKYPDKSATELDLTELLDIYDYSEDEEERQVAHIVLLELVIDRLVLLLQSVTKYMEQMCADSSPSHKDVGHTSVGLVVKRFWARMVQSHNKLTTLNTENKKKNRKINDLEEKVNNLDNQLEKTRAVSCELNATLANFPIPLNEANSRLAGSLRAPSAYCVSRDESNKACQTYETAFVPCESCDLTQKNLRETGNFVISVCKAQGLPSSLLKHKSLAENTDWMTGSDVSRWTAEQNKDLARISKHLEHLESTINPLKEAVASEQKKTKEAQQKMLQAEKEVKLEKETQCAQRKQYEQKITNVERERGDAINKVVKEKERVDKNRKDLEGQLQQMTEQLKTREELYKQLELTKIQLERDMEDKMVNNDHVHKLEANISALNKKLQDVKNKLEEAEMECSRERAKNKSVSKHTEAVQSKQESLLQRLDEMDQENEDLRQQVSELEEERETIQESLEKAEDKRREVQRELKEHKAMVSRLEQEKSKVDSCMQELREEVTHLQEMVQEAKEQQRLLVEYPDLNGPVAANVMGTGDVSQDMENQVKANSVRIRVLEEQNASLRHSITKMLQAAQGAGLRQEGDGPLRPVPLWNPDDAVLTSYRQVEDLQYNSGGIDRHSENSSNSLPLEPEMESPPQPKNNQFSHKGYQKATASSETDSPYKDSNALSASHKVKKQPSNLRPRPPTSKRSEEARGKQYESFVVGKISRENSKTPKPKSRPPSATTAGSKFEAGRGGSGSTSSIAAYMQLKNSGMLSKVRPQSGHRATSSAQEDYEAQDVFVCHKCDKMYNSKRDLEVHKSYCYGGL